MKKKIALALAGMCVLPLLSGCKEPLQEYLKFYTLYVNLNGGSYTEEFITEKEINNNNYQVMINLNYYDGAMNILPQADNLIAPQGKVFAGWYYKSDCKAEDYVTESSMDERVAIYDELERHSCDVFAKWIDEGTFDVLIDLKAAPESAEIKFTTEYQQNTFASEYLFVRNVPENDISNLVTYLPTSDDVSIHPNSALYGFTYISGSTIPLGDPADTWDYEETVNGLSTKVLRLSTIIGYPDFIDITISMNYWQSYFVSGEFSGISGSFTQTYKDTLPDLIYSNQWLYQGDREVHYQCKVSDIPDDLNAILPTKEDIIPDTTIYDNWDDLTMGDWKVMVRTGEGDYDVEYLDLTKSNIMTYLEYNGWFDSHSYTFTVINEGVVYPLD